MGACLNGIKIKQPYFNGIKVNACFNGSKIWISKAPLALLTEVEDNILTEDNRLIMTEQALEPMPDMLIPEGTSISIVSRV